MSVEQTTSQGLSRWVITPMVLVVVLFGAVMVVGRMVGSAAGSMWFPMAAGLTAGVLVALGSAWRAHRKARTLEADIARRKHHVAEVLKESTDAIVGVADDGNVIYWNRGAEILYGRPADEMIGRQFQELVPEGLPPSSEETGTEADGIEEFLVDRLTRSGERVTVLVRRARVEEGTRECMGCRALEEKLFKLEELERQISHTEQLATVGQMAAGLAHEIKNPLAGISGAIQVLADTLPGGDDRQPIVEKILEQVRRIDGTVRDLLSFATPKKTSMAATDLHEIIDNALAIATFLPSVPVQVVRRFQRGLPMAFVDQEQFQQVLANLFINAIQAMPHGGTLTISTTGDGFAFHIRVADTGAGIPPGLLTRIFDPFFTTKTRGTGLGLPICRRVVDAHGGTIAVSSVLNKGTEFSIMLPYPKPHGHGSDVAPTRAPLPR